MFVCTFIVQVNQARQAYEFIYPNSSVRYLPAGALDLAQPVISLRRLCACKRYCTVAALRLERRIPHVAMCCATELRLTADALQR